MGENYRAQKNAQAQEYAPQNFSIRQLEKRLIDDSFEIIETVLEQPAVKQLLVQANEDVKAKLGDVTERLLKVTEDSLLDLVRSMIKDPSKEDEDLLDRLIGTS